MHNQVVFLFGVEDLDAFAAVVQAAAVANLATAFRVERRLIQNELVKSLAFLAHFSVFDEFDACCFVVVTNKLCGGIGLYLLPVVGFDAGGCARTVFLNLELLLKTSFIYLEFVFSGNQRSEV